MHILFIPSWYSTPTNPIRGSFFRDQALALHKAGHRVGMLVPPSRLRTWHGLRQMRRAWRRPAYAFSVEDDDGLATYRIPWWGWRGMFRRADRVALSLAAFDRYVEEQGRPDVVHGHSVLYGGYLAAQIRAARGVPAVVTEHSTVYIRGPVWPDQRPAIRFTFQNIDRLLAVSQPLAASLQKYGASSDIEIVPNMVDVKDFQLTTPLPIPPFRLALIAHLGARKAPHLALHAFAKAFKGHEALLTFAGSGPALPALRSLTEDLGLRDAVLFPGRLSRGQVRELIQNSHVVVSSSHVETFGVTLIEAMACGKPVIATRSGGPETFVHDDNGLLVPTGDVEALADAMRQMAKTYHQYDPDAIRADCVARFSEDAFVRSVAQLYHAAIADFSSGQAR